MNHIFPGLVYLRDFPNQSFGVALLGNEALQLLKERLTKLEGK